MDENYMHHYYKLTNSNSAPKRHLLIAHSIFFNDFTRVIFEMVNLVNNISIWIWMEITCRMLCIPNIFIVVVKSSASFQKKLLKHIDKNVFHQKYSRTWHFICLISKKGYACTWTLETSSPLVFSMCPSSSYCYYFCCVMSY